VAIPKEKLLEMYRNLLTARRLDEKLYEIYSAGGSGKPWLHRGTGEEAIPVAVLSYIRKDDYYHPNFRTQFCLFVKGFTLRDVIASECVRDLSQVGGHDTYLDVDYGICGVSGTLGEDIPINVGTALSAKLRKTDQVCVCTYGDGAASRGPVHEGMVVAAAWKLPIVFIIQNNQYAVGHPSSKVYMAKDIADIAKAYGFPGQTVDGNDIIATYEVVKEYVDRARSGGGPGLIVFETYRLRGHSESDPQSYRPKGEVEEWWKKDPLPRYQKRLMDMGILSEKDVSNLEAEIKTELNEAAKAALAMPSRTYEEHVTTAIDEL